MAAGLMGLTDSQWQALKAGPGHVFALVAAADEHADRQERDVFAEVVRQSCASEDELLREVMTAVAPDIETVTIKPGTQAEALDRLRAIRAIVEPLPGGGKEFRGALFELGIALAEASGGQLTRTFVKGQGPTWVRASGTSATEHAMLEAVAEALGLA